MQGFFFKSPALGKIHGELSYRVARRWGEGEASGRKIAEKTGIPDMGDRGIALNLPWLCPYLRCTSHLTRLCKQMNAMMSRMQKKPHLSDFSCDDTVRPPG